MTAENLSPPLAPPTILPWSRPRGGFARPSQGIGHESEAHLVTGAWRRVDARMRHARLVTCYLSDRTAAQWRVGSVTKSRSHRGAVAPLKTADDPRHHRAPSPTLSQFLEVSACEVKIHSSVIPHDEPRERRRRCGTQRNKRRVAARKKHLVLRTLHARSRLSCGPSALLGRDDGCGWFPGLARFPRFAQDDGAGGAGALRSGRPG